MAAVLIAVVLVAATAGIALAQSPDGGAGPRGKMMARVAQILGIDQQKLENAFKQASKETRAEALDNWLKKLVTDGKINQQQADAFKAWVTARPADVPNIGIKGLEKLVQEGKLTQQQLDAFKAWMKAKPDIPLPKPERPAGPKPPRPGKAFFPGPGPAPQSK